MSFVLQIRVDDRTVTALDALRGSDARATYARTLLTDALAARTVDAPSSESDHDNQLQVQDTDADVQPTTPDACVHPIAARVADAFNDNDWCSVCGTRVTTSPTK